MIRRLVHTVLAALAVVAIGARPASAGNIALTGHDDDYHCIADGGGSISDDACLQISQLTKFVQAGSALPLLVIDPTNTPGALVPSGSLEASLTDLGFTVGLQVTNAAGVTPSIFDPTKYSALIVASDSTCGGCDNTTAVENALSSAADKTAINNFFNAGGGIFALTGASQPATYYAFLPVAATGAAGAPFSGYASTGACGVTVTSVNNDATHSLFPPPTAPFCVAENIPSTGQNVTLVLASGSISTSSITTGTTSPVPEPATLTLLGLGMVGAAYRRRRRQ